MNKKKNAIGFRFALKGVVSFFSREQNAKIHFLAALLVVTTGICIGLEFTEWLWIALAIALVFITEMLNSAIELLCDLIQPGHDERAGRLKDIAAGAVLVAVLFALTVAGIIFVSRLIG